MEVVVVTGVDMEMVKGVGAPMGAMIAWRYDEEKANNAL